MSNRYKSLFLFLFLGLQFSGILGINPINPCTRSEISDQSDSLTRQLLYNGRIWRNNYITVTGDPFLFTEDFLNGSVTINGRSFSDIKLRYDIYNDELLILTDRSFVLQLNKELTESFSFMLNGIEYLFRNLPVNDRDPVSGFVNVLFNGDVILLVKYRKEIGESGPDNVYGTFYQKHKLFVLKDTLMQQFGGRRGLLKILYDKEQQIREFQRSGRIIVSRKYPDSFIPVFKFYENLKN